MFAKSRLLPGIACCSLFLGGACVDEPTSSPVTNQAKMAAAATANPTSSDQLIHWGDMTDDSLWANILRSDSTVDIGLKLPSAQGGMSNGRVILGKSDWSAALDSVSAIKGVRLVSTDTLLPIAQLKLATIAALAALRKAPYVSYVEPGRFVDAEKTGLWSDNIGCSVGYYGGPAGSSTISPGDVLPWNYMYMNIPAAWTKAGGSAGGAGVTVGIVDTGVDYYVPELNSWFDTGMSTGRTFTKEATSNSAGPAVWHDDCGHGTRQASVIGAPRNGIGMLGVAWKANLYMVRVDNDVILTNVAATRLGIRAAAQHAKIVAMAFGTYAYYQSIADELSYWYNFDNLFIAVAGTTPCWDPTSQANVTFPGTETTVTTVTGIDQNGGINCNSHYGSAVDFTAYVDQPAQGLAALGSNLAGFSGSSNASGVIAGIAALDLARYPTHTRAEILTDLSYAASPTGYRSNQTGWGHPNALCVVGGMCSTWVNGPTLIQTYGTHSYSWTAGQAAAPPGNVSYHWSTGENTATISRSVTVTSGMTEYDLYLTVTITDASDGSSTTITKQVLVRDPYNCPTCW